jgi:glycogen debranching enzyme
MVTCLDCSFMQEIAEYPLYLVSLVLWHYRLTGDLAYLAQNYTGVTALLENYRTVYEKDGLLRDLDKWCVVEWPMNFRDGYDVDITEGQICHEPHVALNAFYLEAIRSANTMAAALELPPYRDEAPLLEAFYAAFYDQERHLFTDSLHSNHVSYIGNVYPFAFRLYPDETCKNAILRMIEERGITAVSMFGSFPLLYGLLRCDRKDLLLQALKDEGAWLRILREGGTATFEGWGKDTKWNTSLFHLTLSDAAVFLADIDQHNLFL